jgi:putative membrane protein
MKIFPAPRFSFMRSGSVLLVFLILNVEARSAPHWRLGPLASSKLARNFAVEPLATDTLRPNERTFLEKAGERSRHEIRLARLAVAQATSADVKAFAQQLTGEQQQINDAVEALRQKKGAVTEAAPADVPSEATQKLAQKTGADFDREFVRLIGEVQSEVVALFEQAMANAKDTDVRDLAGLYLPTLRDHQNKVTELKKTIE